MLPLYQVGEVDWLTTQTLYHTLAKLGEEGVVLCWPKTPYVSLGCHQNWEDYNAGSYLPVLRRRVGGSLVYLDRHQVFFQIIVSPSRLANNRTPERWYHYALDPIVSYLQELGLTAELRLPADILVNGRKISGNAGGQLDEMVVIVGNLLLDFSIEAMVTARSGPHETWHRAFTESMDFHLTTLQECCPQRAWTAEMVMEELAQVFAHHLGAKPMPFPWNAFHDAMKTVGEELTAWEWLQATRHQNTSSPYSVKVREGVYLYASRNPDLSHIVAEVDHNENRILRVWGWEEAAQNSVDKAARDFAGAVHLSCTGEELQRMNLAEDVKQLFRELLAKGRRLPI